MARIVLVTGGARSGKSAYAQELAEGLPGKRAYIATCPVIDDELRERIRRHREARGEDQWDTIEETQDIAGVIRQTDSYNVLLLDCLTLWINNLMYAAESTGGAVVEEDITLLSAEVVAACRDTAGTVIFVTNEVGMGIVPDNPISRRYRDLVGRCNQAIAAAADDVILVTCGIPLYIKQRSKIE